MIAAIDGKPTPTTDDLSEVLAGYKPKQTAKVELLSQDGTTSKVTVTLGELPGS